MTSSLTTFRSLMLPVVGGDAGVWGTELNNGVISVLDTILGTQTTLYSSNAASVTLTSSQCQVERIACFSSAAMTVTIPQSVGGGGGFIGYAVGSNSVTFQSTGGGTTVTVPTGNQYWIWNDGTNITAVNAVAQAPTSSWAMEWQFDGNTGLPQSGVYKTLFSPFTCTLQAWYLIADTNGTCAMTIGKIPIGSYGGSSTLVSIQGGNAVGLTAASVAGSTAVTTGAGWTTAINYGDVLGVAINNTPSGLTKLTLALVGIRTVS